MKYWCKKCKTKLEIGDGVDISELFEDGMCCPFDLSHGEMEEITDWETPVQREKRTGKSFPDNGAVFYRPDFGLEGIGKWIAGAYWEAKENGAENTVIADPPVPPPDDFVTEED